MQKSITSSEWTEIAKGYSAKLNNDGTVKIAINGTIHTELNPTNFEEKSIKIKIFETQVKEWFLNRANELIQNKDNDFIVLMICSSYIESIWQYIRGRTSKRQSKDAFTESLKEICITSDNQPFPEGIYSNMRCGLFHNNMLTNNMRVRRRFADCIKEDDRIIYINPVKLLEKINGHFNSYIISLDTDTELYANFNKIFKFKKL